MDLLKVIKFEGDDTTLVWKHLEEDFNTQSQLIVHESQEAILFKDGKALDLFGPGKYTLNSENIPLLRGIINIPTEGVSPFHCEVYFINKATALNIEWGTSSRFEVLDPTFNVPLSVGASGAMEFLIKDSRKFLIKVVGTQVIVDANGLIKYFREKISTKVKSNLAKIMAEVSYLNVNQHLEEISEALETKFKEDFEVYGVNLINFYLSTIIIPEEDTDKLKETLNKKMEYGTLGFNWADEQIADIFKKYVENPGGNGVSGSSDNVTGLITEIPLALAFGSMIKSNIVGENSQSPFSNGTLAFNQQNKININSKEDINVCSGCGTKLAEDDVFCSKCGTKVENELICSKCGHKLKKDDVFCSKCGTKVNTLLSCSECGAELNNEDTFCSKCGHKIE